MSEKVYLPIPPPPRKELETPPVILTLTEKEQTMYDKVFEHYSNPEYTIPGIEKDGQLTEDEKFWLSYECILRYFRATKWHSADKCILRLDGTLKWRREFGLYDLITPTHVEPEAVTGKSILFGYDTDQRPAFYMIPSRQNTEETARQIHFVVWTLERAIDLMGPGVETLCLLIDYGDISYSNRGKNPSLSTARSVLNILQDHYPERLGRALILNVPFLLNAFYKIITPFIDPITRPKMKFNPSVVNDGLFTADMVMKQGWGGDQDFEYEHEKYWPELVKMSDAERETWKERWVGLGGKVGLREWDYKRSPSSVQVVDPASVEVVVIEPKNNLEQSDAAEGVAI